MADNLMPTLVLAGLALAANQAARADVTFTVNTVADLIDDNTNDGVCHTTANTCSLRAAIMQANHWSNPEFAIINLPSGVYALTIPVSGSGVDTEADGDLDLTAPLTTDQRIVISGESAANTIIDGNQMGGVVAVGTGRSALIARVTIRNGNNPGNGGGILNQGSLTVVNSVIEGNTASDGGAIYNNQGTLLVDASTIRTNIADSGGGLYVFGHATLRDTTISGNHAMNGGGIYNNNNLLVVVNSTLSANTADNNGGGIFSRIAAFIYNTTVVGNDADDDHDENGGIGGGVYADAGSRFVVVNSLIADNYFVSYVNPNDCHGTLEVYGWNLFSHIGGGCVFSGNGNSSWGPVSPSTIGLLQDNGGPTWTHALLPGSQAINSTIDSLGCVDETGTPLSSDQRGGPRPVGLRCDVGAFEYGSVADIIFRNGFDGGM